MQETPRPRPEETRRLNTLMAYVADLEMEVDRLRKRDGFLRQEARDAVRQIREAAGVAPPDSPMARASAAAEKLAGVVRDLHEPGGYHPAYDQVVAIAVRPLAEQVFRAQQRLTRNPEVVLRLELESEAVEWFPGRLRHVLDNLFSNALRYRDPVKAESWVTLSLRVAESDYEFRLSDNGVGMPGEERRAFDLMSRAVPARQAGLGVGLPVVQRLIEQCGGRLEVRSEDGRGTDFLITLPRYDLEDYLT
jgi:signal transduction histidine kinase